ncbi:MAG: hypothetical protein II773_05085 [Oscillospiraceae bacterium]|nr:hypothetical protein [Oscillospiraceae bacterium]MBQ4310944.1 hypothetical protein [Oscillospiraceae bacterium]MCR5166294.1 hypothetical protein [Oscillospiraceae bacterium]
MNSITLAKKYTALLDEVYKESAVTAVLESDSSLARAGANANEIVIPKLAMDGLADYSRNSGYVDGDVTLTWETAAYNYERGRMFTVDNMDNAETQNTAFGRLAGEFVRTKAVPEMDAFRFAEYASATGVGAASADLSTGAAAVAAIRTAVSAMDEAEVPAEGRILFITPTLKGLIDDMDTTKSKAVFAGFEQVITVPQTRFYTKIKLNDGVTSGETAGGYAKASDGKNINFMIVHKAAVLQFTKHALPKIIPPALNPDADAWKYGYRSYGLCSVYANKTAGIYVHSAA